MSIPEKVIEKSFITEARKRGVLALKLYSDSTKGFPDRTVFAPKGTFFVEFKRKGKPLQPHQKVWRDRLKSLGFNVYVIDDTNQITKILDNEI